MAFTYKNPLEIAINKLPSKQSDQLLSLTSDQVEKKLDVLNAYFSFSTTPEIQELLTKKGVAIAPVCFNVHSHPACKMIENHILYVVLPSLLREFKSVAFFSLRDTKVNNFLKMYQLFNYGKIKSIGMFNAIIDGKDSYRYGCTPFHSFKEKVLALKAECCAKQRFPKILMLHDELHFLEPEDIAYLFEQIPEIGRVVATTICPVEILKGDVVSREPRIYGLKVKPYHDRFFFFPDGCVSEGYEQRTSTSTWPFKYRCIRWLDRSVKVTKLYSLFAHHVFSFERGRSSMGTLMFDKPSCLLDSELSVISKNYAGAQIERGTLSSLCTYLCCLKSPNAASAVAKLRQLEKRDLFPDELSLVYSLGTQMSKFGLRDELTPGIMEKLKDFAACVLPECVSNFFLEERNFHIKIRALTSEIADKQILMARTVYRLESKSFGASEYENALEVCANLGVEVNTVPERRAWRYQSVFFREKSLTISNVIDGSLIDVPFDQVLIRFDAPMFSGFGVIRNFRLNRHFLRRIVLNLKPINRNFLSWECANEDREVVEDVQTTASNILLPESSEILESVEPDEIQETASDRVGFEGQLPNEFARMFISSQQDIQAVRMRRKNDCVFRAIAQFLRKDLYEVLDEVINSDISDELFDRINGDRGLDHSLIEEVLMNFNLQMACTSDFKDMFVLNRRFGRAGKMYCTLKDNHCELADPAMFQQLMLQEKDVAPSGSSAVSMDHLFCLGKYKCNGSDAKKLASSFNRGTTGVLSEVDKDFCKEIASLTDKISDVNFSFEVGLRLGFAGSGKSRAIIKWIQLTPTYKRAIISPRRALADDFSAKVKGSNTSVMTFETALKRLDTSFKEVIIDEISIYPQGYIALLQICMNRRRLMGVSDGAIKQSWINISKDLPKFLIIGDPLQTRYYSRDDQMLLAKKHDIDLMIENIEFKYLWQAYRFGEWFKEIVDIPTRMDGSKFERKIHPDLSTVKKSDFGVILCASQDEKARFVCELPIYTFGESQGLTFEKKALIVLSQSAFASSVFGIIVALTRSMVGFDFCLSGITAREVQKMSEKTLWSFPLEKKRIPNERLMNLLGKAKLYSTDIEIGSIQDKAKFDPFILPYINLAEEEDDAAEECGDIVEAPEWFKCHVPVFDCNPLIAEVFEKVCAKEKREFQSMMGMSNQFLEIEKKGSNLPNPPMAFQNIFPHHQASDDVTFWEGVKKRIKKSNWRAERAKLDMVMIYGKELKDRFLDMLPLDFKVNIDDINEGEKSFIEKRKLKAEKMWENHKERSDIDWALDRVFLFMKSQFCTKEGKMFTEAKAGQTLACFQHIVLYKFGPMLRAIERAFLRACGDSYYIHSGKNFMCLDAFVRSNEAYFQGDSVESDYTAFDSSQDHVILAFEIELLRHLEVSESFVQDYIRIKLSLGSRIGELAIMRFTGEFCTFLFNTFANMLFTKLKYEIDHRRVRIMFAGDDMCSLGGLKRNSRKRDKELLRLFSLTAIEEVKKYPMFCGWYISPDGILKSPKLLWSRICMMAERNMLHLCVDNYLFEAIFAYRLGERLYGILKEEDFEYHYLVTRFFVKNSELLKGASRDLIFEIGEGIGCRSYKSTNSLQKLNRQSSRLTQSRVLNCTKMQISCTPKCLTPLKDLRQMLKFVENLEMAYSLVTSLYWTTQKLKELQGSQTGISTCTLGLYWLASRRYFQILKGCQEESSYMMVHAWTQNSRTLLHTVLSLSLTPVTWSYGPNIAYQQRIKILEKGSGSELTLIVQGMKKKLSYLRWTLEPFTDKSMQLDFFVQRQVVLVGHLKQFTDASSLNMVQKLKLQSQKNCHQPNGSRVDPIVPLEVVEFCCQTKYSDQEAWWQRKVREIRLNPVRPPSEKKKALGGQLGRPQLHLKEMSLKDVLALTTRTEVLRYLWINYIDKERKMIPETVDLRSVPAAHSPLYKSFCRHYCCYLFGNIAVYGASAKTLYPAVAFTLPTVNFTVDNVAHTLSGEIRLDNVVKGLDSLRTNSPFEALNKRTFRNLCECFAEEAYEFLRVKYRTGLTTNLYMKWPSAFRKAPWVAFDFASGLNPLSITSEECTVIDRMTKRLFRTEGQRGVFESAADHNLDLEG